MEPLDKTERNIISLLQEDGRMPFVKMAEILGVTEGTIRRKVYGLIENGITRIGTFCDPYTIGFDAPAFVGINAKQKKAVDIVNQMIEMPEVQFAAIVTGPYEIMVQIAAKSNKELFNILQKFGSFDGVISSQTFLILQIYKQTWDFEIVTNEEHLLRDKKNVNTKVRKSRQFK